MVSARFALGLTGALAVGLLSIPVVRAYREYVVAKEKRKAARAALLTDIINKVKLVACCVVVGGISIAGTSLFYKQKGESRRHRQTLRTEAERREEEAVVYRG